MSWILLATRVLLAVVFVAAGVAKLLDRKGSQKAITDFGLPIWTGAPLGIALPLAEIAVALMLVPVQSVWFGGIGALVLLLTFSTAIAINIGLGRRPECHCFGQMHSEPVGWPTLLRNGALALLAAFLVIQTRTNPGPNILSAARSLSAAQILLTALVLVAATISGSLYWLILHLFRQNGRLLLRIEALETNRPVNQRQFAPPAVLPGLSIGTKAASFDLPKIGGGRATLEGFLREDRPLLLISTDPKCGPCNALMTEIAVWQRDFAHELTIALLSHGRLTDNEAKAIEYGISNLIVEKDHDVAGKYQALGTPTAVLIRKDGTIGSPALGGADRIRELIRYKGWTEAGHLGLMKALGQPQNVPQPKPALPRGSVAPAFKLSDLSGNEVDSAKFNGNGTMLVFWNPACGFCQRMLPELKKWEGAEQTNSPRLVLISGGTVDANRAMGLNCTILIDDKFSVGQLYGASGTPSGLLLDANGRIATELAIGQPKIMDVLAGT
jgi:thioredoxin-related protein